MSSHNCMQFKLCRNFVPIEVIGINQSTSNSEISPPIQFLSSGFCYVVQSKKVIIWRFDGKKGKRDLNMYEMYIPPNFLSDSIFVYPFETTGINKIVSFLMISTKGQTRFWNNIRFSTKYIENYITIMPFLIKSIEYLSNHEFVLFLNDNSFIQLKVNDDSITHQYITTKSYVPKILTNILSPFTRRSSVSISCVGKMNVVEFTSNPTTKFLVINNSKSVKIVEIVSGSDVYIKRDLILSNHDIICSIFETFPELDENIPFLNFIDISHDQDVLYLLIELNSKQNPTYSYFLVSIPLIESQQYCIKTVFLIEPSTIDRFSNGILKYSNRHNSLLIVLNDRIYIFNCSQLTFIRLRNPTNNLHPLCVAYCPLLTDFCLLFTNRRCFYLGPTLIDNTSVASMFSKTTSFDNETIISSTQESTLPLSKSTINPLIWGNDPHTHFELAFNKYMKKQTDLSISLVSSPISQVLLFEIIAQYSNRLTYSISNIIDSESKSLQRRLSKTVETHISFLSFLKDSNLWQTLYETSHHKVCLTTTFSQVLKNIEISKLCYLVYHQTQQCTEFAKILNQLNESYEFKSRPNPDTIIQYFHQIIVFQRNLSYSDVITPLFVEQTAKFFFNTLIVFESTVSELKYLVKVDDCQEFQCLMEQNSEISYLTDPMVYDSILSHISFSSNMSNNSSFLLSKKLLLPLHFLFSINLFPFFPTLISQLITMFEKIKVDDALDLSINFLQFSHFIQLCVDHNRMDLLNVYKDKWSHHQFDQITNNWLAEHKKWHLLSNEMQPQNLEEVSSNIPQLAWVYHAKNQDFPQCKNSLKNLILSETNIFFKKTYSSIFRMLEYSSAEQQLDADVSFHINLTDFQQLHQKSSSVLSLQDLIQKILFNNDIPFDVDTILKCHHLILHQNSQIRHLVTLVWSATVLADPFLKNCDIVTESDCKAQSFFYQCLAQTITANLNPDCYADSLCQDVNLFLAKHLEESLPAYFFDRMISVFEICQDTLINTQ